MVDGSHRGHVGVGAVSHRDAVPAILQLPSGLLQVSGGLKTQAIWRRAMQLMVTVLAPSDNIPLLRPPQSRPPVPRVLPSTILAASGGNVRSITRAFLVAVILRHGFPPNPVAVSLAPIPGDVTVIQSGLHLEPSQSGYPAEFSGAAGFHCSLSALGVDGI